MKKQHYFISALLIGSLLLSGCGKIDDSTNATASPYTSTENDINNSQGTDNAQDTDEPSGSGQTQEGENSSEAVETPVPKSATVSRKKAYSDAERTVSILGLQEYEKIKTDKYTDKASKGKKYLVLFLEVYNKGKEKDYFNVNYLTAKVDGEDIENTFLFNEPEGYPTIFTNIAGGDTEKGFIVWEVPEKWKQLDVTYEGWRDIDGLTLDANLTKKDLKKPEEYSGKNQ